MNVPARRNLKLTWIKTFVVFASTLPAEIHVEILVKPLIVRLKELFQPLPGNRVHFLVVTFVARREGLL